MVKFRAEVNEVNPYKIVVDTLGKEKEEKNWRVIKMSKLEVWKGKELYQHIGM